MFMPEKIGVIYKYTNPVGSSYIGKSVNMYQRRCHYKKAACKSQVHFYHSLLKYGFENHKEEILEECNENILAEREKYWIIFYNTFHNGMNLTTGGEGYSLSKEAKNKISNSKRGELNPMYGIKGEFNHRTGQKATNETLQKLRASHIGKMKGKDNPFFSGYVFAYKDGILIGRYEGIYDAANKLKLHHPNISKVILGKRPHTGGFYFERKNN